MTQPETPSPSQPRAAPTALWRALSAFLTTVIALFGPPEEIAALGALRRDEHTLILAWLRAGEAFLRRLLFIEAVALVGAVTPTASVTPGPCKPRERRLMSFYPDKPEDWRVSFRAFARRARGTRNRSRSRLPAREPMNLPRIFQTEQQAHAPAAGPSARARRIGAPQRDQDARAPLRLPSAWPLAERLEAMRRAFNDPMPHARRLARALERNGACAARVLHAQSTNLVQVFGAQAFVRCDAIARRRWRRIAPTSRDTG